MHLDKSVVGFGTFFLVMALIVPPGLHAHWGMQGIFFACGSAGMVAFIRNARRVEPFTTRG